MTHPTEAPMANAIDDVKLPVVRADVQRAYDILCSGNPPYSARESNALRALRYALGSSPSASPAPAIDDVKGVSDADADREMMDNSEMYVQGRFAQMILQDVGNDSRAYYDASQLRAAFRAGYDYANRRASPAPSQHTGWSDEAVEGLIGQIDELLIDAEVDYPIGFHKGMHRISYDDEAMRKAIRATLAKTKGAERIAAGTLSDQVILELRAAQHVLGYPDALGDAIEAISGIEEERVRLWNEVRDLKSSLNVEKATTDTIRIERDAALTAASSIAPATGFEVKEK